MKRLYTVELNEIHCATFEVEATSEQDAVNEVLDGAAIWFTRVFLHARQ